MRATREVQPDKPFGGRLGCGPCGGEIGKEEPHGRFVDDDGDWHDVCLGCVDSGDGIGERMLDHADTLEREAAEMVAFLRSLAGDKWVLPTRVEIEEHVREWELRFFGPEIPLTLVPAVWEP